MLEINTRISASTFVASAKVRTNDLIRSYMGNKVSKK